MPLVRGDVVVTPTWHWHDHGNESNAPVIWLDMLNLPLFRFAPVHFAEMYNSPRYPSTYVVSLACLCYYLVHVINMFRPCDPCEWRHPWGPVEKALNASDASHTTYAYTNADGKPLSTTLTVQAERLSPGAVAESQDSCSYIYHCYEGTGRTEIETPSGEKSVFKWTRKDTFAIPAWSKIKHVNESTEENAYLVACHDGPFLDLLGLRRP